MPQLEFIKEEAPEEPAKDDSSSSSTTNTPATISTPSSSPSLNSPSPETSALFRILTATYENDNADNPNDRLLAFPREQTLLDVLLQSSGIDDLRQLRQLREVRLRVVASAVSLSRLESYTPNIRILRLDGSGLTSLREIGTTLNHLRILHVSRCGLNNLDGTFGLTNLVELYAADNCITNVGPCAVLENIKIINLDRNPIASFGNVSLLSLCPQLFKLSIRGTPLSKQPDYRMNMKNLMPNLRKLDGHFTDINEIHNEAVDEHENDDSDSYKSIEFNMKLENSSSVEISSMTYPSSEDFDDGSVSVSDIKLSENVDGITIENKNNKITSKRPSTAPGISSSFNSTRSINRNRPFSAQSLDMSVADSPIFPDRLTEASPSYLTSGGIVCGNIARALTRARPAKRPIKPSSIKPVDPWVIGPPKDDDDDAQLTVEQNEDENIMINAHRIVLDDAMKLLDEPFPEKPLESAPVVDLELGITGLLPSTSDANDSEAKWNESSEASLIISKKWRKAFKLYRKKQ